MCEVRYVSRVRGIVHTLDLIDRLFYVCSRDSAIFESRCSRPYPSQPIDPVFRGDRPALRKSHKYRNVAHWYWNLAVRSHYVTSVSESSVVTICFYESSLRTAPFSKAKQVHRGMCRSHPTSLASIASRSLHRRLL